VTSSRVESAQRLADTIVSRFDITPPVDVAKLVEMHATIHPFPSDVPDLDAVLLGLDSDEKHVFVNTKRQLKRRRFTLAHELGHILLPWHQAHELICESDAEDESDDPDLSHRLPGSDPTSQEIRRQEMEADAFAARTLVPKRFVEAIAEQGVPEMLEALQTADVSIPAGMRALSDTLPAGYVFALLDDLGVVERTWRSSAGRSGVPTILGITRGEPIDKTLALRAMADSGWSYHYGRRIWWARADIDMQVPEGTADWKPLLRTICEDAADGPIEAKRMWGTVCAIGGALLNEVGEVKLNRMAGLLTIRLRRRDNLSRFVEHPLFDEFVAARSRGLWQAARKHPARKRTAATSL
jgi:Zn-dependent peptidase ImmA (M78 family)